MLISVISWIYISCICTLTGIGILSFFKKNEFHLMQYMVAGIVAITVYVEFFSIWGNIGAAAHLLMLAFSLISGWIHREKLLHIGRKIKPVIFSWEGVFYLGIVLFLAFFTSRGDFHTDTNIYHAQMIRLYEEYGLIKGMGNLQLHFAYNSAYLAFASIFSLNWLLGYSLHTTTGFLTLIMCIYAFHRLKNFHSHKNHITDFLGIGILFYSLVILTRIMSPATDFATMLFSLYLIMAWCENMEEKKDITTYSLLSILAVYIVTLKFSACLLVLLAVYPAVYLIKQKEWKKIISYISCGFIILLPFLIRNFFISGWLLYPFDKIDIFQAEWKIPKEYLLTDANQIKVWGRGLYDISKIDLPVTDWLPVWWSGQTRYSQMLIGCILISTLLLLVQLITERIKHTPIHWDFLLLLFTIYANLGIWFFMAPFIRYGLAFLLVIPMIATGKYLDETKKGFYSLLSGSLLFCMIAGFSPYWDNYITDAGVFIKQNISQPYYIFQKDYDKGEMESMEIKGNTIYYSPFLEINSYHVFPGTCYDTMLERTTLIGDTIKEGFKPK